MTAPSPETVEREKEKLWVTDAELIRRMGVPEHVARPLLREFESKPQLGFPRKQKLWGDRRYWPAVKEYLDRRYGLNTGERDARKTDDRRRPGSGMEAPQRRLGS
jgi:hypothetical protein